MARIAGAVLPGNKRIEVALTAIKGIGRSTSRRILQEAKISLDLKAEKLTEQQEALIRSLVEKNGDGR
jgi:small subunit ribosomal protein S13